VTFRGFPVLSECHWKVISERSILLSEKVKRKAHRAESIALILLRMTMTTNELEILNNLTRQVALLNQKIDQFTSPGRLRSRHWTVKQVCDFLNISKNHCYKIAPRIGGHKIGTGPKAEWRFKPELVENFRLTK
jgi:hypothetical protein